MNEKLDDILHSRKIKPTAMRELVLKILSEQTVALGLTDLEHHFEKADRITLYRTLKTFEANKLIHRIEDGTGSVKYAMCNNSCLCNPEDLHVHFHCIICVNTYCLDDNIIPSVILPADFELQSINMVVKGVCAACHK
jgi:Fur family ferric uptake transcriptional regulator